MRYRLAFWRTYGFVWVACAAFAVLWDYLFWGKPAGVSVAVFVSILAGALLFRAPGLWRFWQGRITVLLAAGSFLALIEEPSPLAVLVAGAAVGTMVLVSQREMAFEDRVGAWMLSWIELAGSVMVRTVLDNSVVKRWMKRHPGGGRRMTAAMTMAAWWVLPMLAGAVFVGLFAIANPIIERWIRELFDRVWRLLDWLALLDGARVLVWIAVAVGAYGVLRFRRMRVRRRDAGLVGGDAAPQAAGAMLAAMTGSGMIVRCLLVFNLVFAIQTALDVIYLFGGGRLPAGMSYAQYAHRGAYPLIFTALLAGWFVLVAFKSGGAGQRSAWCRRLVYVWIAQNIFLLVSTIWRIWLYVDVYSLTRLRVAVIVWVGLVALGFLWIVRRIALSRSNGWLWRMNVLTLCGVLYACAFINFDGLIADFNVRHCREVDGRGAAIDIAYLKDLGPESLPALEWLRARDASDGAEIDKVRTELAGELKVEMKNWRGWTYRRWREAPVDVRPEVAAW